MNRPSPKQHEPLLQIIGPTDNWVLERLARRLAAKLPYARFVPWKPERIPSARIAYYVNYGLYNGASGFIDVAFFTHNDETLQFLQRARQVEFCVSMSKLYADWLAGQGVRTVAHIPMGFDYYGYRPRLVLGVIGRLDHPRKGRHLIEQVQKLDFVEVIASEGLIPEGQLRELYQRVDYVLIAATVEGGPLCLLEGLGMGKPVIAPENVGMVPEFPEAAYIRRYPAGNAEALVRLVTDCYEEKVERSRLVRERTWDAWAEAHDRLFTALLRDRGLATPTAAAGFRFGLLGEIDVPLGIDVGPLEEGIDRAACHLYFGEYASAQAVLKAMLPVYPFVEKLLPTIPKSQESVTGRPERAKARPKALR
jgi:glycosyltransferase involved in cell wall biosynthesis